jgi:hypothetical protein
MMRLAKDQIRAGSDQCTLSGGQAIPGQRARNTCVILATCKPYPGDDDRQILGLVKSNYLFGGDFGGGKDGGYGIHQRASPNSRWALA